MPSRVIRLLQHYLLDCPPHQWDNFGFEDIPLEHTFLVLKSVWLTLAPPQHISDLLCVYNPTRLLRSSGAALLTVLRIKSKCAEGAFTHYGPVPWNKLPADLRLVTSVHTFINRLKRFLFTQVYTQQLIMYVCVC